MNEIIIGIDLGTTNSEAAFVETGKARIISDDGRPILPSVVGVGDNGEILVGEAARNQYLLHPDRTVKSIKRRMGEDVLIELAGESYTPQEISAMILKRLKQAAERELGQPIDKAVITVPAYFSDAQRRATREAGEIAGLEVVRMINEPTAAALAYGAGQAKEARRLLVYDLGGGTFDVSVVEVQDGVVAVLSSHGDNRLGGDDFDRLIVDYLLDHLRQSEGVDASDDLKAMARINRAAENAKKQLSDQPFVRIDEEYLLEHKGQPVHLSVELSRLAFEEMIGDFVNATLDAIHIALKGAKLTTADIDDIILAGGSTRIPCIRERLLAEFGFEAHGEVDADLCVALGAAVQAAMIAGQQIDTVLVDVTPYSYGTSAIGTLNGQYYPFTYVPVIHKNSALPVRKSEAFMTHKDGQDWVEITIYQGEDPDALNNIKIGEFRVEGLRKAAAGNIITLTLELDLNGILHVSAREKETGLEKSITIKNALARLESDALENAQQRITALFAHLEKDPEIYRKKAALYPPTVPEIDAAKTLLARAESLFGQVTVEDREDMSELIETIAGCIDSGDIEGLEKPMEKLTDMLYYLEG